MKFQYTIISKTTNPGARGQKNHLWCSMVFPILPSGTNNSIIFGSFEVLLYVRTATFCIRDKSVSY